MDSMINVYIADWISIVEEWAIMAIEWILSDYRTILEYVGVVAVVVVVLSIVWRILQSIFRLLFLNKRRAVRRWNKRKEKLQKDIDKSVEEHKEYVKNQHELYNKRIEDFEKHESLKKQKVETR